MVHKHSVNGCVEVSGTTFRVEHGQKPEEEQLSHLRSAAVEQHSLQSWQVLYDLDCVLHTQP